MPPPVVTGERVNFVDDDRRRETLQGMPLDRIRSNGYIFLVEMAYVAYLKGFRIYETPIYFADRRWGKSKMSFKIQLEATMRIWDVRAHYRDLRKQHDRQMLAKK